MKQVKDDEPFYPISMAAQLVGVTPDRLRTYEEEGILIPHRVKTKSTKLKGFKRLYSKNDLEWVEIVRELIKKGVNIPAIRLFLSFEKALSFKELNKLSLLNNSDKDRFELILKLYEHPVYKKIKKG